MRIAGPYELTWLLSGSAPPATTQQPQPTIDQPVFQPNPIADLGALRSALNAVNFPPAPAESPALDFRLPATSYQPLDFTPTNSFAQLLSGLSSPRVPEPITVSGGGGIGSVIKAGKTVVEKAKPIVVKRVIPGISAVSAAKDIYDFAQWLNANRHPQGSFTPIVDDRGHGRPYNPAYPPRPGKPF